MIKNKLILESERVTIYQGDLDGKQIGSTADEYQSLEQISEKFGLNGHIRLTTVIEGINQGGIYQYDNGKWTKQNTTKGWGFSE